MKFLRHTFHYLSCIVFLLYSCDSSEDVLLETAYLRLEIDESQLSSNTDFWVILTNDDGEVLADSLIEKGGPIEFIEHKKELSEYLGIYFINVVPDIKRYDAYGYLNIAKNSSISFDRIWQSRRPQIGKAEVEITNFPINYYHIDPPVANHTEGLSWRDTEIIDANQNDDLIDTIRFEMAIVQQNDTLFIGNSYKDKDLRYLKIEGVNNGDIYSYDFFEDFVPYEHVVTYEATQNEPFEIENYVVGYNGRFLLINSRRLNAWSQRFTQFGYVNGFDYYITFYGMRSSGGRKTSFTKRGGAISTDKLDMPNYALEITDSSFIDFNFSHDQTLTYRKAMWQSEDNTSNFHVYENLISKSGQLKELPNEIQSRYDFIDLRSLKYVQSEFIENIEGYEFTNYIGAEASMFYQDIEYEYYSFRL